jgi:hypothetical protein
MVYVRLAQGWTDSAGTAHDAGAMVDVDAATLAGLEASGVVAEAGSSLGGADGDTDGTPQPGDDDTDGTPQPGGTGGGTRRGGSTDGTPQPG